MKIVRTVKVCYLLGIIPIIVACYYITWHTTLALWENPELAELMDVMPPETWTPELKDKHKITVYPYRTLGSTVLLVGIVIFYVIPTMTSQIVHEVIQLQHASTESNETTETNTHTERQLPRVQTPHPITYAESNDTTRKKYSRINYPDFSRSLTTDKKKP